MSTALQLPNHTEAPEIVLPVAADKPTGQEVRTAAKVSGLSVANVRQAHKWLLAAPVGAVDATTWIAQLQMTAGEYALHWLRANYKQKLRQQTASAIRT